MARTRSWPSLLAACFAVAAGLAACAVDTPEPEASRNPSSAAAEQPSLEMIPVLASDDDQVDLEAEAARLRTWLDEHPGFREEPALVTDYVPSSNERLGWLPHLIEPRTDDPSRWEMPLGEHAPLIAVAGYTDSEWNGGRVPADAPPYLVEFVPVGLAAERFTGADVDSEAVAIGLDQSGRPALKYRMRAGRRADYGDWTEELTGRHVAIVVDGEVRNVALMRARISGPAQIAGDFSRHEVEQLRDAFVR